MDQFFTALWTRKLRRWIVDNRGNLPNIDELVDDMRQEAVNNCLKLMAKNQEYEVNDAVFMAAFINALNDNYRRVAGHLRAPQKLIKEMAGDDRLANDIFRQVCIFGESEESTLRNMRLLIKQGKRDYDYDEDRLVAGIQFVKSNGICKPPRVAVSIDSGSDEDGSEAGYELSSDSPDPYGQAALDEIAELIKALLMQKSGNAPGRFEDLVRKFGDDEVLSDEQKFIMRIYYSGDKLRDAEVAEMVGLPPHTLRRRRTEAYQNLRNWLVDNGLGDLLG